MSRVIFILFPMFLFATSPFETPDVTVFELSAYETTKSIENKKAEQNPKIKCRWVCDKKVYKEQKISDAIEFYKNSKNYFNKSK